MNDIVNEEFVERLEDLLHKFESLHKLRDCGVDVPDIDIDVIISTDYNVLMKKALNNKFSKQEIADDELDE